MTLRTCAECGEPAEGTYCPEHTTYRDHDLSATARGYDSAWRRLSKRARMLQRFCTDCGTDQDLTLDHLPSAWERKAAGKRIRLGIDCEVVCRPCNGRRGAARSRRGSPPRPGVQPQGEAKFGSHMGMIPK